MGVEIKRIEKDYILKNIQLKSLPITLTIQHRQYSCFIDSVAKDALIIKGEEEFWKDTKPSLLVNAFFSYFGQVMTFQAKVLEIKKQNIVLLMPEDLYKNLQRKFQRVAVSNSGLKASFTFEGNQIELTFPKTKDYTDVDKPQLQHDFDDSNIAALVSSFRSKMSAFASESRIEMFRERQPDSFEENLLVKTGRALYLPSTQTDFPAVDPFPDEKIITKAMLIQMEEAEGFPNEMAAEKLNSILQHKTANGIISEIYCPILYQQYVAGYVYLCSRNSKVKLDLEILETVCTFAKVLAYSLKTNGYFDPGVKPKTNFDAEVIDISAAGMLFSHTSEKLARNLLLYSDIIVFLTLQKRFIRIVSRITRKFSDDKFSYFGIQFLDINREDFLFLFKYLYGREYTAEDEEKWEGGSPPPVLQM